MYINRNKISKLIALLFVFMLFLALMANARAGTDLAKSLELVHGLKPSEIGISQIKIEAGSIIVEGSAVSSQTISSYFRAIEASPLGKVHVLDIRAGTRDGIRETNFRISLNLVARNEEVFASIDVNDSGVQNESAEPVKSANLMTFYPQYEPAPYVFKPDVVKKYKHKLWDYDFLIDVGYEMGCIGHLIYAEEGKFSEEELEWLRMLLAYRFNGTRVDDTISEEISDSRVSDNQIENFMALPEFSNWIGPDFIKKIQKMKQKRAALIEASNARKWNRKEIFSTPVFLDYSKSADELLTALISKFSILYKDTSDCDHEILGNEQPASQNISSESNGRLAPSLDCSNTNTRIEEMICSHSGLSELDGELSIAYQESLERDDIKQKAIASQRQWLKNVRDKCQSAECLNEAYKTRIKEVRLMSSFGIVILSPSENGTESPSKRPSTQNR